MQTNPSTSRFYFEEVKVASIQEAKQKFESIHGFTQIFLSSYFIGYGIFVKGKLIQIVSTFVEVINWLTYNARSSCVC